MEGINWFNWFLWILDIIQTAAEVIFSILTFEIPTVLTVGEWFFGGFEFNFLVFYNLLLSTELESLSLIVVLAGGGMFAIVALTLIKLIPTL